jgi:hypothetical protein
MAEGRFNVAVKKEVRTLWEAAKCSCEIQRTIRLDLPMGFGFRRADD